MDPKLRVGLGFDLHRFGGDRDLVLGGVPIPDGPKVVAHSDGDVVYHALIDAILGALGKGDIGEFFPPGDKNCEGAKGIDLYREMLNRVGQFEIVNLDISVVLDRPKLAPYKPKIRANLSRVLGVEEWRISVKAKTSEGLFVSGVVAQAVVLLRLP